MTKDIAKLKTFRDEWDEITTPDDEIVPILDKAIDYMCRYQQIEQIINDHDADRMPKDYWYIDKIREAIEK